MEEKFVKISIKELSELLEAYYELVALECAGVDNWSFYGDHRGYYLENCPEKSWSELIENVASEEAILDAYELVKHGEWIQGIPYICSVCGKPAPDEKNTSEKYSCWSSSFCPHCGAIMDGSKAE